MLNNNLKNNNADCSKSAADNSAALGENAKNSAKNSAENSLKTAESAQKTSQNTVKNSENAQKNAENAQKKAENVKNTAQKNAGKANEKPSALKSDYPSGAPKKEEEKKSKKGVCIAYAVNVALGLAIGALVGNSKGLFGGSLAGIALFACLSDSFFVPGILLAGFGALLKIAEGGFFDGVGYGLKRAALSLIPGARIKKEETYAEYKERKEKSRKHAVLWVPLIVGGVFVALGAVFLILYNSASGATACLCGGASAAFFLVF